MRRAFRRAFTLIELIVVVIIIAILLAILFPVFAQAKQAAKRVRTGNTYNKLLNKANSLNSDSADPVAFYKWNQEWENVATSGADEDTIARFLRPGVVVTTDIDSMTVGETKDFTVAIGPQRLADIVTASLPAKPKKQPESIRIAPTMTAQVTPSAGLTATLTALPDKKISNTGTTRWTWKISATDDGPQELTVELFTTALVNGKAEQVGHNPSFKRKFNVEVSWKRTFRHVVTENVPLWYTLLAALSVTIANVLFRRRKLKRAPPDSQ